jgi:hypothetical protein
MPRPRASPIPDQATAFTIADLSVVWILCDVYRERPAQASPRSVRTDSNQRAYPDKVLTGTVSDIGPVLDPSLRTAKVRIEVANPGILKLGMFVTATFDSSRSSVRPRGCSRHGHPSPARPRLGLRLRLADKGQFRRDRGHHAGDMLPNGNKQEDSQPVSLPGQDRSSPTCLATGSDAGGAMIRKFVDFSLQNRFLVLAVGVMLFAWGIVSFHRLPVEAYPDVANNYVDVIAQWPGISAEQIEQQVTIPIEVVMNGIPGVVPMCAHGRSSASPRWRWSLAKRLRISRTASA